MKTARTAEELAELRASASGRGSRVGFVPTMGALHAGHLSLVEIARREVGDAGLVVASIFVNPTQFAPHEDFDRYPRPLERDRALLEEAGCDALFLPEHETIYPPGFGTWIYPAGAARGLEGDFRPHFFRGVATVVSRLFALVQPDVAVFGEKDAQQLAVIGQLVRDLALPVAILGGPILRESDGLAMSSRNAYLSADERRRAPRLYSALLAARALFEQGERRGQALRDAVTTELAADHDIAMQYVEVVDPGTFSHLTDVPRAAVVALAVKLGKTRLIDNIRLEA